MKKIVVKILVVAGALAAWDLFAKEYFYSWAATQEPLASSTFGTAVLGYLLVLSAASIVAWFLTREKEDVRS